MGIQEDLNQKLKDAMRAKDEATLACIRMVRAKVIEAKTAKGFSGEVDDALHQTVISQYVKQLQKTMEEYAGQGDKAAAIASQLQFEIDFLLPYLPQKLDAAATRELARKVIAELGVTDVKMAGKVLGAVMKDHKDAVDPALLKGIVEDELKAK